MAEVTRMFRTLVDGKLMPDTIATRMNNALTEDNDQGMFVTMFIGLINLKTGHMVYCNAGHNPPLLDGEYMEMETNAPIGLWPELMYEGEEIDNMRGKTLFVYTDGINEAENLKKEQFGEARLQALLKLNQGSAREISETVHKAVEDFVGGAEPSDDLTKMCIKL
jgi:serine phosphatase RsbU (regulator of sigma subunit)